MSEELKPCKCGCGGWAITDFNYGFYLYCHDCGIMTTEYDTEAEAIEMWNKAIGITHEKAVDYLQETGWMEDHDYWMMEMGKEMALEAYNE